MIGLVPNEKGAVLGAGLYQLFQLPAALEPPDQLVGIGQQHQLGP